jgi:CheY-like chemotaxis protein
VPRILVADDNSNIHRMISLALKDAGVEVVAVGNGEAAVRKIAEIKPDLILADIFMPVRNGYEVCEFVKRDPRFSGIPVVLLIGAFDPFDEREAQRVQADGILKKPFVPPDALLRTVADLLAQSAARMAPVPVAGAVAKADHSSGTGGAASAQIEAPKLTDEAPEDFAAPKAKIKWNADEQPVAFGSLLETPSPETDEPVATAQRDPTLGEPAFWGPSNPEQPQDEAEGEEPQQSSHGLVDLEQWGSAAELELPAGGPQEISAIESALNGRDVALELSDPAEPIRQPAETASEGLHDPAPSPPELPLLELPAAEEVLQPPEHSSLPEIPAFAAPPAAEQKPEPEKDLVHEIRDFSWAAPSDPANETIPENAPKLSEEEPLEPASVSFETFAPFLATLASATAAPLAEPAEKFSFDPLPSFHADSPAASVLTSELARLDPANVARMNPADMEAVVQRVIDRMQPQIIDLVTRELLRPVVEALVQRELEKK